MATVTLEGLTVILKNCVIINEDDGEPEHPIEQPPVEQPPIDPPVQKPPINYPSVPADAILVGPTRQYKEPAAAYAAVPVGGTMAIDDGIYYTPFHCENYEITIMSASGNPYKCYFDGKGGAGGGVRLAYQKGMIHSSKSINVMGIGFRRCGSPASGTKYSNEAGIWIGDVAAGDIAHAQAWRCAFDNNGNGCFADTSFASILIEECLYGYLAPNGMNAAAGGAGGGPAHDNYLACKEVEVNRSTFWGCCNGHNIKSRSPKTEAHYNTLMQDGGRVMDISDGGDAVLRNNIIYTRIDRQAQSPKGMFGNANMVAYATESQGNGAKTLFMSNNVIHVNRLNSLLWCGAGQIASSDDVIRLYDRGSIVTQGNVTGLPPGVASGSMPALPQLPSWAYP